MFKVLFKVKKLKEKPKINHNIIIIHLVWEKYVFLFDIYKSNYKGELR
jgi:hypothetical protein